jgi:hypothetical protein
MAGNPMEALVETRAVDMVAITCPQNAYKVNLSMPPSERRLLLIGRPGGELKGVPHLFTHARTIITALTYIARPGKFC